MTISEIYSLSLHDALPIWAPFFLNNLPLEILFAALVGLLIISAFFSGSETALMSLNRYRLRHLTKKGHRSAHKVTELLRRPDRLLGLVLIRSEERRVGRECSPRK